MELILLIGAGIVIGPPLVTALIWVVCMSIYGVCAIIYCTPSIIGNIIRAIFQIPGDLFREMRKLPFKFSIPLILSGLVLGGIAIYNQELHHPDGNTGPDYVQEVLDSRHTLQYHLDNGKYYRKVGEGSWTLYAPPKGQSAPKISHACYSHDDPTKSDLENIHTWEKKCHSIVGQG